MTAPARVGGSSSRGRSSQARRKAAAAATATEATASTTEAPETTTTEAPPRTQRRPRTAAAERAYARRAQREGRSMGQPVQRQRNERGTASRVSFVMLVMGLLVAGVITTLWLSTQAIADSYRLDQAKKAATELSERADGLQREVAGLESASTLAEMAAKLGMVPAGDPAHLVVGPDGKVAVVGEPKPVVTTPVPSAPADVPPPPVAPDQAPPEQPGGTG